MKEYHVLTALQDRVHDIYMETLKKRGMRILSE
jgi:hypothetical protein